MIHPARLHLVHPVPLPDLLGGGDVAHDDGVVLVQSGLIQHTPTCRHINRSKIVRFQDAKTPVEVRFLLSNNIACFKSLKMLLLYLSEDKAHITAVSLTASL